MKEVFNEVLKRKPMVEKAEEKRDLCVQIALEELAELQQAISKVTRLNSKHRELVHKRGYSNEAEKEINREIYKIRKDYEEYMDNLAEEMADVLISLVWIKDIYHVSDNRINWWLNYKSNRIKKRLEDGEFY